MNTESTRTRSLPAFVKRLSIERVVRLACFATLASLALMSWSVIDPSPLPVMVSMSVGQAIGTLALACYLGAILLYQLRSRRARTTDDKPATPSI